MTLDQHIETCKAGMVGLPVGPWDNEPHFYRFKYLGMECAIIRHPELLSLGGYVGVPRPHAWYGKPPNQIPAMCHGGATYAQPFLPGLQQPLEELWWIGFECSHDFDMIPALLKVSPDLKQGGNYKSFDFVHGEVELLASAARKSARVRVWGGKRA